MNAKNKYFSILVLLSALNVPAALYFFSEYIERGDTLSYVQTIKYFLGESEAPALPILVKPLSMVTASVLALLVSPRTALFLQNLIFYFASSILVFKIIERLYFNKKQALYGACLFFTSFPVLSNGLSFLTDMTGWFFGLLVIYLTLNFYFKPSLNLALLGGFFSGIGFLFKESGVAGALFFIFLILISGKFLWREKIKYIFLFSVFLILPILISSLLIYNAFHYSYLDWYRQNLASGFNNFFEISEQFLAMFLLGWIFIARGTWKAWKERGEARERSLILLALIPLAFLGLLWPYSASRILFLGAAPFLILGSRGLLFREKKKEIISILLIVFSNYALPNLFGIRGLNLIIKF
ncbi:MAG: glycosyltransferase family 39 protein [Patescibacteria group bacterium]|nr:glycosyltransferase family 39 protein [Patescibacteria group bacterium]